MTPLSTNERMACRLAGEFRDGEIVVVGGVSLVPMAAALLAQQTHAPDLTVVTGSGAVNPRPGQLELSGGHSVYLSTAEAWITIEDVFDHTERGLFDVICLGGLQVDAYGNVNLTYVGGAREAPALRGPGLVNAGLTMTVGRIMLCLMRHDIRTLVEKVDFASAAGRRRPDGRPYPARIGSGPTLCLTPLAALDFGPDDRMRLASLHPGVSEQDVRARTGFVLDGTEEPAVTAEPDPRVLSVLRNQIDPLGDLRGEGP